MTNAIGLKLYEAWVDMTNGHVRMVDVQSTSERGAYKLVQGKLAAGEVIRGIVEVQA